MKTFVYPGSFDPITLGHVDIIERASKMADKLIVAVMNNPEKKYFFTVDERVDMIKKATSHLSNVEVDFSNGLMVEYMKKKNAIAAIRGLRAVSDFEYELQWATFNQKLDSDFQAIFLMADSEHNFLSSSIVRQIGCLGGDLTKMLPSQIHDYVKQRLIDNK